LGIGFCYNVIILRIRLLQGAGQIIDVLHGHLAGSYLSQGHDDFLVFAVNQKRLTLSVLPNSLYSEMDKIKTIVVTYFLKTIFNGNSSHNFTYIINVKLILQSFGF